MARKSKIRDTGAERRARGTEFPAFEIDESTMLHEVVDIYFRSRKCQGSQGPVKKFSGANLVTRSDLPSPLSVVTSSIK